MLKAKIQENIKQAMKSGEKNKLEVLRFFFAQIKDKEIEGKITELPDIEVVKLLNSQLKRTKDALSILKEQNRQEDIKKAEFEIKTLSSYLPEQMPQEELEIERKINEIIKQNPNPKNPGMLIGICVKALSGKADNQRIAEIVKKKLI